MINKTNFECYVITVQVSGIDDKDRHKVHDALDRYIIKVYGFDKGEYCFLTDDKSKHLCINIVIPIEYLLHHYQLQQLPSELYEMLSSVLSADEYMHDCLLEVSSGKKHVESGDKEYSEDY